VKQERGSILYWKRHTLRKVCIKLVSRANYVNQATAEIWICHTDGCRAYVNFCEPAVDEPDSRQSMSQAAVCELVSSRFCCLWLHKACAFDAPQKKNRTWQFRSVRVCLAGWMVWVYNNNNTFYIAPIKSEDTEAQWTTGKQSECSPESIYPPLQWNTRYKITQLRTY